MGSEQQIHDFLDAWAQQAADYPVPNMEHIIPGWGVADLAWPQYQVMLMSGSTDMPPPGWRLFTLNSGDDMLIPNIAAALHEAD